MGVWRGDTRDVTHLELPMITVYNSYATDVQHRLDAPWTMHFLLWSGGGARVRVEGSSKREAEGGDEKGADGGDEKGADGGDEKGADGGDEKGADGGDGTGEQKDGGIKIWY
jgi:hypothetical protein